MSFVVCSLLRERLETTNSRVATTFRLLLAVDYCSLLGANIAFTFHQVLSRPRAGHFKLSQLIFPMYVTFGD